MLHKETIEIVRHYLRSLSREKIPVSKAIVFGSHARGYAAPESDIDLLLVSPLFDKGVEEYVGTLWLLTRDSGYRIEPIPVGEQRYNTDDVSTIIEVARREGVEVSE